MDSKIIAIAVLFVVAIIVNTDATPVNEMETQANPMPMETEAKMPMKGMRKGRFYGWGGYPYGGYGGYGGGLGGATATAAATATASSTGLGYGGYPYGRK